MANKKVSEYTALTTPDDADVFLIVDTSVTTTKKITWANIAAAITSFVNDLFGPISLTVAQAQAMAGGTPSYFKPGRRYKITDAYDQGSGNMAVITLVAYSTTKLFSCGFGTFKNAEMGSSIYCQMWYDLTTDQVYRVYDSVNHNDVKQLNGNAIDNFPFDNAGYENNRIEDCTYAAGAEATSFLAGCTIGQGATIDISSTGNYLVQLTGCEIGAGKTADFHLLAQNYVQTGKVYNGNLSTFEVTSNDAVEVNPDSSNYIDMAKFQFAGVLICDDNTYMIDYFSNYPTDHKWIVRCDGVSVSVTDGAGIKFNQSCAGVSSPFSINNVKDGWVEFTSGINNPSMVLVVAVGNY